MRQLTTFIGKRNCTCILISRWDLCASAFGSNFNLSADLICIKALEVVVHCQKSMAKRQKLNVCKRIQNPLNLTNYLNILLRQN